MRSIIGPSDILTCIKQDDDADCTFEAIPGVSPFFRFIGNYAKHIAHYYFGDDGYFRCSGIGQYWHLFEEIHRGMEHELNYKPHFP